MEKYISIDRVIEEIYASEGYSNELDWNDALIWAGKVLGLIAAPSLLVEKVTGNSLITPNIVVQDYRGELPLDFESILPAGVRDYDTKEIFDSSTDSFRSAPAINVEEPSNLLTRKTYIIKDSYIEISERTAMLELAYRAIKIDENGFPMIPDNERVIEAVRSYITFKIDHKLWRLGKISDKVYEDSKKESLWYIPSAQNALRILTPDQKEVWTRHFQRLLPIIGSHGNSFANIGTRENLNIGFNNER